MSLAPRAAPGRVSYACPRPPHRLRRWPCFAKRNGGYENDEAWLRQKAPAGEDRRALLAVRGLGSDPKALFDTLDQPQKREGLRILDQVKRELFVWKPDDHDA